MSAPFFGLDVVKKALQTFKQAQEVTSHNVANANTPGYHRQRAVIGASKPYAYPALNRPAQPGQVGTGVEVTEITRIKDDFIELRLNTENNHYKEQEVIKGNLAEIEAIFNEPSDNNINSLLDKFFSAFEELSKTPESLTSRSNVVNEANKLTNALNYSFQRISEIITQSNTAIENYVESINSKISEIANYNKTIRESTSLGDNPNDLMDKRDLLISELSEIADVTVTDMENNQVMIQLNEKMLVQGDSVMPLTTQTNAYNSTKVDVVHGEDNSIAVIDGGQLKAYFDLRDKTLQGYLDKLNELAKSLTVEVNTLQSSGYGLNDNNGTPYTGYNFFNANTLQTTLTPQSSATYTAYVQGITQLPEGTTETATLDQLGVTSGTFTVNGTIITLTAAEVTAGTALKLSDVLKRISDNAGTAASPVTAQYNSSNRRIVISRSNAQSLIIGDTDGTAPDDTSNFLTTAVTGLKTAGVGANGAHYTAIANDTAGRITVSDYIINNLNRIAAAATSAGVPGDGSNALAITNLRNQKSVDGIPPTQSFEEYYQNFINGIALDSAESQSLYNNYEKQVEVLQNRRDEISGVSLDEEMLNLIKYQQSYQAAARVANTISDMLDTLINGLK